MRARADLSPGCDRAPGRAGRIARRCVATPCSGFGCALPLYNLPRVISARAEGNLSEGSLPGEKLAF
ncbi:hypothetical protein BCEN4_140125 [Burkholderia cenocepacia]|nr:hypothetical protein BCEN4_140125 [Burkholderia cenocepacia]CAG9261135.1 hypothetical protein BCEP4_2360018 [Burkholderia cepacia]